MRISFGNRNRILGLLTALATTLVTTLACPAQLTSEPEIASGDARAAQSFNKALATSRRQFARIDRRIARLSDEQSAKLTSFVLGNIHFVLLHELGHAIIDQLKLPVLGREEDAADSFATLAMLSKGPEMSHKVLHETVRSLWLIAQRDKHTDPLPALHDEHTVDVQRASKIVCLMVGSDRKAFKDIAAIAKMPPKRQKTCEFDFEQASDSWEALLKGRSRVAFAPRSSFRRAFAGERQIDNKSRLKVAYHRSDGKSGFRRVLKAGGALEAIARFARENLSLPRPIAFKAMQCGEPNAYFDERQQKIVVCFELVGDFIELWLSASTSERLMAPGWSRPARSRNIRHTR